MSGRGGSPSRGRGESSNRSRYANVPSTADWPARDYPSYTYRHDGSGPRAPIDTTTVVDGRPSHLALSRRLESRGGIVGGGGEGAYGEGYGGESDNDSESGLVLVTSGGGWGSGGGSGGGRSRRNASAGEPMLYVDVALNGGTLGRIAVHDGDSADYLAAEFLR